MAAPSILALTTAIGKLALANVTTSPTSIVTNSAASGKVLKINSLIISNVDGTSAADITVDVYRSSTAYHIVKTVAVDADSSFTAIDKDLSIYLEEGDALRVTASATGDLQAVCSYEDLS
jgi:hypothetical protein